ncbi:MAG: hypothetical protein WD646_13955 [Actinomycetota bacterium]
MAGRRQLDEKIVAIGEVLRSHGIPHAIGGAIALAYYGEPRTTIDIDVNVFVDADRAGPVLDVLAGLGIDGVSDETIGIVSRVGQIELLWDETPIDLFFMNHPLHRECAKRVRQVPFGTDVIKILAVEDLVLFKIAFNRRKDWIDLEQVLFATAGTFDLNYLRRWADDLFENGDPRLIELQAVIERILGPDVWTTSGAKIPKGHDASTDNLEP